MSPRQYSSQMAEARIVIVNFNAGENLQRCMAALLAQTKTDFEVRIVDNARRMARCDLFPATTGF